MIQVRMHEGGNYTAYDSSQQEMWSDFGYNAFMAFLDADITVFKGHLQDYFYSVIDIENLVADAQYADLDALLQAKSELKSIHPYFYYDQGSAILLDMLAGMMVMAMRNAANSDMDLSADNFRNCLHQLIHDPIEENIVASTVFPYEQDLYEPTMIQQDYTEYDLHISDRYLDEADFIDYWVEIYNSNQATKHDAFTLDRLEQMQARFQREVFWIIDASAAPFKKLSVHQRAAMYRGVFGREEHIPDVFITRQVSFSDPHEATGHRAHSNAAFNNLYNYSNYPFEEDELACITPSRGKFEVDHSLIQELSSLTDNTVELSSTAKQAVSKLVKAAVDHAGSGLYTEYGISSLYQLLFLQMEQLMLSASILKRCRLCNLHFITGDMKVEYCSRPAPSDPKSTCSEVGSYMAYKKKLEEDIPLQIYNRAYKTHFARMKKQIMSDDEWTAWRVEAKEKLEQVRAGLLDQDEFAKWLKI